MLAFLSRLSNRANKSDSLPTRASEVAPRRPRRPRGQAWVATTQLWKMVASRYCLLDGDREAVSTLLRSALLDGADATCSHGLLPGGAELNALMKAAFNGRAECLEPLLSVLNPDATMPSIHWTALMYAAAQGQGDCVQILAPLSDPALRDFEGRSALDIAMALVERELACLTTTVSDGLLALARHNEPTAQQWLQLAQWGVLANHPPLLRAALDHCDARKLTIARQYRAHADPALNVAAECGLADALQCLLDAGADPLGRGGERDRSALECAVDGFPHNAPGCSDCAAILRPLALAAPESMVAESALLHAIASDSGLTRTFFAVPDLNFKNAHGNTALHLAARFKNTEILEALLVRGADIRLRNEAGLTPLDIAFADKNWPVADALMSKMSAKEVARAMQQMTATLFPRSTPQFEAIVLEAVSGLNVQSSADATDPSAGRRAPGRRL